MFSFIHQAVDALFHYCQVGIQLLYSTQGRLEINQNAYKTLTLLEDLKIIDQCN